MNLGLITGLIKDLLVVFCYVRNWHESENILLEHSFLEVSLFSAKSKLPNFDCFAKCRTPAGYLWTLDIGKFTYNKIQQLK